MEDSHVLPVENPHLPSGDFPFPPLVPSIDVFVANVHHAIDIILRTG